MYCIKMSVIVFSALCFNSVLEGCAERRFPFPVSSVFLLSAVSLMPVSYDDIFLEAGCMTTENRLTPPITGII